MEGRVTEFHIEGSSPVGGAGVPASHPTVLTDQALPDMKQGSRTPSPEPLVCLRATPTGAQGFLLAVLSIESSSEKNKVSA